MRKMAPYFRKGKLAVIIALALASVLLLILSWQPQAPLVGSPRPAPGSALLPPLPPGAVPPPQHLPLHPALARSCYHYFSDLTTKNLCRKMINFTHQLDTIHTCIRRANHHIQPFKRSVRWVLLGDSHMRFIFTAFLTRLNNTSLQYHDTNTKSWKSAVPLELQLHKAKAWKNIEVRDTSINLDLNYYWDPLLKQLPGLVKGWLRLRRTMPSLLVFGAANHFMIYSEKTYNESGAEAAMGAFVSSLRNLKPLLTKLAQRTTVVFKLLDDLRRTLATKSTSPVNMVSNYILYNTAAIRELAGTGVVVWDSTLPLSFGYNAACNYNYRITPPRYHWKCNDKSHMGYIVVEQYADMILNDYCSHYL